MPDATQETFVPRLSTPREVQREPKISTWLYAIATNLVKDRYAAIAPAIAKFSLDAENERRAKIFRETVPEKSHTNRIVQTKRWKPL